jgi:hypothetical protein
MNSDRPLRAALLAAWTVILLTSLLPKVILQEIFGLSVSGDMQMVISVSVIVLAFLASLIWKSLRSLRPLLALLLVLFVSQWLVYTRIDRLPIFRSWLGSSSFNLYMPAEQSLNSMVTLLMIAALLLMRKRRSNFYLVRGDTAAPVEPIRWLGVRDGERWNKFGAWLSVILSLGTLAFLVIAGRPSLNMVSRALPFMPVVLLMAAANAFNEEMTYKASFLSVLEGPVGPRQALYMVAVFFGIGHYYGVPYGVVGVLMAGFLGWLLARSMQETRGFFWAWFIHFWQDVWIFFFLAVGSIAAGGA